MAASGRSSGDDVDDDGALLRPPPSPPCSSQPTCCELLSGEDSKTPNPRPTKTMRMEESSDPPLPWSSEVVIGVDLHVPPPLVDEEESSEKPKGQGIAQNKIIIFPFDSDDDVEGWGFLSPGAAESDENVKDEKDDLFSDSDDWSPPRPASSPGPKKCNICDGGHYTWDCVYLSRIPHGAEIANYEDYVIVCYCGGYCKNGGKCDNDNCTGRPPRWVQKKRRSMPDVMAVDKVCI